MEKSASVSSRLAKLQRENRGNIKLKDLTQSPEYKRAVRRIAAIPDSKIDLVEIPEWSDEQWQKALIARKSSRGIKKAVSVRLDAEVIDWLKAQGEGRLTGVNAILRLVMEQSKQKHRS